MTVDLTVVLGLLLTLIGIISAILAVPRMVSAAIEKQVNERLQHYYTKLEIEKQFVTAIHHGATNEDMRDELRQQRRLLVVVCRHLKVPDSVIDDTVVG